MAEVETIPRVRVIETTANEMAEVTRAEIERVIRDLDRTAEGSRRTLEGLQSKIDALQDSLRAGQRDWALVVHTVDQLAKGVETLDVVVVRGNGRESLRAVCASLTRSVEASRLAHERLVAKVEKHITEREVAVVKARWALASAVLAGLFGLAGAVVSLMK